MLRKIVGLFLLLLVGLSGSLLAGSEKTPPATIALGPVDVGYGISFGDQKPADIEETIRFIMKKELEKKKYSITLYTPPADVGSGAEVFTYPTLPTDRTPTEAEMKAYQAAMQKYMASMQKYQRQAMGLERPTHVPVNASYYFDFKVRSSETHVDTSVVRGLVETYTNTPGIVVDLTDPSSDTTKVFLECSMRDPKTGDLMDRKNIKTSRVVYKSAGGIGRWESYTDYEKTKKLFESASKDCAKWISKKVN